jgi:hypothetical protein
MDLQTQRKVFAAFDGTRPLTPEEGDLYVDLDPARGMQDTVTRLVQTIVLSPGSTCQALSGHKGSGKSTELGRAGAQLEGKGYLVVNCPLKEEDIDLNDVDFPEILLAIIRRLAGRLRETGIEVKPSYLAERWRMLQDLMFRDVTIDSLDITTGLATIHTAIKGSPEMRDRFRKAMEPDTGNWMSLANDLIGKAVQDLGNKGKNGIVLIVDDLDKMTTRPLPAGAITTSEYLFVNRQPQLAGFDCHVIYTVPLDLLYSSAAPKLAQGFGCPPVVPMTKVRNHPPDRADCGEGMALFRELVARRLRKAGVCQEEVFENTEVLDDIIRFSGGQPSELMLLLRQAFVRGGFPVRRKGLELVKAESRRTYALMLRSGHRPILEEVRDKGALTQGADNEKEVRELLFSRAVLAYINGSRDETWYVVNPAAESWLK